MEIALIIKGIKEQASAERLSFCNACTTKKKLRTIIDKIGLSINKMRKILIKNIRKLQGKKRSLLAESSTRRDVLINAKNLKGSDIWTDKDYPKNTRRNAKKGLGGGTVLLFKLQ